MLSRFSKLDNCRLEVAGDLMSGVPVDKFGVDVRVKFGNSRLNSGRIITLWRPDPFKALLCSI